MKARVRTGRGATRAGRAATRAATSERRRAAATSLERWLVPAGLVLVALVVRLWALEFEPWVTIDGTEYIRIADAMRRGAAMPSIFPPGYPALIALARLVIEDRVMAAASVSVVCGALLPALVWWLARRVIGPWWGLLPALVTVFHPRLIEASTWTMSESAYLAALHGALVLAAMARPLWAGIASGVAFAFRPEALLPAAALLVAALRARARGAAPATMPGADAPRERARGNAPFGGAGRLRPALLFAFGFLVLATPCWIWFRTTLGVWTVTPKVAAAVRAQGKTWAENEPRLAPVAAPERYDLVERLTRNGADALRNYPRNAVALARGLHRLWPVPLLALALWGLMRRRGIESIPLLQLPLLPLLAVGMQERFLLGAIPSLALLAAFLLHATTPRVARSALAAVWLGGAGWMVSLNWRDLALPFDGHSGAQQEAGEWLAAVAEPEAVVMDRWPHVAFYANRNYRVMPDEPYDVLVDAAVTQGVHYFVIDEGVARIFRKQILPLLYEPGFRDREQRLQMIYAGGHHQRFGVAIFRVLRPGEAKTGDPPEYRVRWRTPGMR